jgi:hypothetical protein
VANSKNPAEANLDQNAPEGLQLSDAEMAKARKEGANEDVKDAAKDSHRSLTDGVLPGEIPDQNRFHGWEESQQWAHNLDLGVDAFVEAVTGKDSQIPDEKVYGLLALERNGQNRTPYVKAMMKRLKVKADELPGGGPSYTNDVTNITDL